MKKTGVQAAYVTSARPHSWYTCKPRQVGSSVNPGSLASSVLLLISMPYRINAQGMQKCKLEKDRGTTLKPGVTLKAITEKERESN